MRANKPNDIWARVKKGAPEDCWSYVGSKFNNRYGRFFIGQKAVLAHRVVYELENGPIQDGLFVMHKCNNKSCCNPSHLIVGTNSENQRHASASGAWKLGVTGQRGITFDAKRKYWIARGYRNGKRRNLYTGPFREKAMNARAKWERENLINFNGV